MKVLKMLVLCVLVCGFNCFDSAQACGKFDVVVEVQNEAGEPIDNAFVQLTPITKDETTGKVFELNKGKLSNFMLELTEGQQLREFHRLIISADGYKTAENALKIVSCDNKNIKVKLVKNGATGEAVWNFYNRIVIQVTDVNNTNIEKTRLTVMQGEKITTQLLIENGYLSITFFPNGIYDFQLKAKGFQTAQFKVDSSKIAGQDLKFQLKEAQKAVLTGTVKLDKKIIEGAVIHIRDADYNEYFAKTDGNGIYLVTLPFGKYNIYSTVNDKCWMCAEFYKNDFLINKEGEIKLDIELQFHGEG